MHINSLSVVVLAWKAIFCCQYVKPKVYEFFKVPLFKGAYFTKSTGNLFICYGEKGISCFSLFLATCLLKCGISVYNVYSLEIELYITMFYFNSKKNTRQNVE